MRAPTFWFHGKPRAAGHGARRGRPGSAQAPGLTLLALLLTAGCADTRISLEALHSMEQELAKVEPLKVQPDKLALTESRPYTVGPGDVLSLTMVGLMEPYSETIIRVRVHDDGRITLPLVGAVPVAGLSLQRVEKAIRDAHVPKYVKALTVYAEVVAPETTTVFVVGAAATPGMVQLPRNRRNVLYALAMSGSFSPATSGQVHVRPIRADRHQLTYDLTKVNDLRRALLAPPLESGDMIIVEPAETSAVYVTGLVNVPGAIPVPPSGKVSLVRAIAASGGLRDFLEPEQATLWRRLPDGQQVRVKVELADVLAGKRPDISLYPGDVLQVPHTPKTRLREWALANLRVGPFGVTAVYDPVADYRARILRAEDFGGDVVRRTLLQSLGTGISTLVIPPVVAPPAP